MSEDVFRLRVVRSPIEGEVACQALRAKGIKCACIEMPSDEAQSAPDRFFGAAGDTGMVLTVIVAPEDAERATAVLKGAMP